MRPSHWFRGTGLALLLLAIAGAGQAQEPFRFVVLGHIRGDASGLNPKLAEVLEAVRQARPRAVFLAGDIIWGDYNHRPTDSARVEAEWDATDSALATLGVPVYRVPGNHDINDGVTREIWFRRYGDPTRSVTLDGQRFLLLASGWVPAPGDTGKALHIRVDRLGQPQVAFLEAELARPAPAGRTFVVMHHLLWWAPDSASWWRDLHPRLAQAGVAAVFSGDYGPMKFSTLTRDSVRYFQASIEGTVPDLMQRVSMPARLLSSQFDNFLVVTVTGGRVDVDVRVVGAVSSGQFTPERWRSINTVPPPEPPLARRVWRAVSNPRRLALLLAGTVVLLSLGWLLGRASARRAGH